MDYDGAIAEYTKVMTLSSDGKIAQDAQYWIGQSQFRAGRFDAAQATFAKLLDAYPTSAIVSATKLMIERTEEAKKTEAIRSAIGDTAATTEQLAAGATLRRAMSDRGYYYRFLSLSPDGKYISGADMTTGDLAVYELATGKERRLTNKGPWTESWDFAMWSAISPDSKRIAYVWYSVEDPSKGKETYDLRIIGLDGSEDRVLRRGDYIIPRDWSSDGKLILGMLDVLDGKDEEAATEQMVWVSADDGSMRVVRPLGKPVRSYRETFVDISPDERFIAYDMPQEEDSSRRDIFLCAIDGTDEIHLVQHPANDKLLGWTPDGRSVFFASDRLGTWDAWLQEVEEGKPRAFPKLAKSNVGDIVPIGFTPSGSYYYETDFRAHEVFTAKLDLQTGKVLTPPTPVHAGSTNVAYPDWSPDGEYLAYYSPREEDGSQTMYIYIRTLKTGKERTVNTNLPGAVRLRWCPDAKSLLVCLGGNIFRIDAKAGERTTLLEIKEGGIATAELSPDGETLCLVCRSGGKPHRVLIRDLKSAEEEQIFEIPRSYGFERWSLSPDGQSLAISFQDLASWYVKIVPVDGGEPREVLRSQQETGNSPIRSLAWTPDSQHVIFARGNELWRISAEGGEPQKIWETAGTFLDLRIHPDGQHVAFAVSRSTSEVWMMENFLPAQETGETENEM
jgi:Tol biopolymer transport system component